MGAVSGWLLSLGGVHGLKGWQWLFLMTGLPALLVGLLILQFLPESPAVVPWLSSEERAWIERELAREADAIEEPGAFESDCWDWRRRRRFSRG
jgi:MFS family permease